jgi:hypothetical protein
VYPLAPLIAAITCWFLCLQASADDLAVYVSPGVVLSTLDAERGRIGIGGELSVPVTSNETHFSGMGPVAQLQWTPRGLFGFMGAELFFNTDNVGFVVEAGWFGNGAHEHRPARQGAAVQVLLGYGYVWLGPRLTLSVPEARVSGALNLSVKWPLVVRGTHFADKLARGFAH